MKYALIISALFLASCADDTPTRSAYRPVRIVLVVEPGPLNTDDDMFAYIHEDGYTVVEYLDTCERFKSSGIWGNVGDEFFVCPQTEYGPVRVRL